MCLEIKPVYLNGKHMGTKKENSLPIAVNSLYTEFIRVNFCESERLGSVAE